jgi:hypothetical protein
MCNIMKFWKEESRMRLLCRYYVRKTYQLRKRSKNAVVVINTSGSGYNFILELNYLIQNIPPNLLEHLTEF